MSKESNLDVSGRKLERTLSANSQILSFLEQQAREAEETKINAQKSYVPHNKAGRSFSILTTTNLVQARRGSILRAQKPAGPNRRLFRHAVRKVWHNNVNGNAYEGFGVGFVGHTGSIRRPKKEQGNKVPCLCWFGYIKCAAPFWCTSSMRIMRWKRHLPKTLSQSENLWMWASFSNDCHDKSLRTPSIICGYILLSDEHDFDRNGLFYYIATQGCRVCLKFSQFLLQRWISVFVYVLFHRASGVTLWILRTILVWNAGDQEMREMVLVETGWPGIIKNFPFNCTLVNSAVRSEGWWLVVHFVVVVSFLFLL